MHMKEQTESDDFEETEPVQPNEAPHRRIRLDSVETESDVPHRRIPIDQSTDYSERIAHLVQDEFMYQDEVSSDVNKTKSNEIIIE